MDLKYLTGLCHAGEAQLLSPYLNTVEVKVITHVLDSEYTNRARHFTAHTALVTVCMLTVFILFAVQPMKLGEHLNSLLLNMCDDVTLSRMSLRTVLDICSKHIRNSSCDPPFSYIRKLVRLVLGSLSQVHVFFFFLM